MNIKQAKEQIRNTLRAYLSRDELGNYRIPAVRQRPVLLIGPPGIGKTQIMEQIAAEENVGLVSYTITHHTRQSAIGLPFIEKRMSEILGSVYELMEKTGLREGILFLDEINCVSETLAPMMLQFLQCKTFGNQKLPEGWLIVAAGNPPEYNRSVRDFDVVTLDRVKRITVEEDFPVWKEYALRKGLHGAVISYLDLKKENFYRIENSPEGMQFATARGWEDLSEILYAYEALGIAPDTELAVQYVQMPAVARDFTNYYALYNKYRQVYHIDGILHGQVPRVTVSEFASAPFDEKLAVMGLMLSRLGEGKACAISLPYDARHSGVPTTQARKTGSRKYSVRQRSTALKNISKRLTRAWGARNRWRPCVHSLPKTPHVERTWPTRPAGCLTAHSVFWRMLSVRARSLSFSYPRLQQAMTHPGMSASLAATPISVITESFCSI